MTSFSRRISDALTGKKVPGLAEICTLLNFDELPAALVDTHSRSLLFLNSKLMKEVSFSTQDILQQPVDIIFQDLDLKSAYSSEMREVMMNRRNQTAVAHRVRFEFIDPDAQWIVIKVLPAKPSLGENAFRMEETFRKLKRIARISDSREYKQDLQRSLDTARELLMVDSVCLYEVDSTFPQLKKITQAGDLIEFPQILPSTDLVRLENALIWDNGHRVLTELHRFARLVKVEYLGSAPLVQGEGVFGLLVAGGSGERPIQLNLESLELLASLLYAFLQHHFLVVNLNDQIQDLEHTRNQLGMTFENMNEGVIVLSSDLKIENINPSAEWMLGYAGWEVKGQSYENILIGTDRLFPALIEAQKGKTTHNIGKASLNRRNGQAFPVQIKVIPVFEKEKLQGIELLITDVSEHEQSKALTQQLEHRAVLGDYTAAFAHDVRNPINNISTGLQLLAAKLTPDDPKQDLINRMQGDCTRLNHLMESFLAFSRPLELKFEKIQVEQFLKRILDRWQPRMARENVKSLLHVESGVEFMLGDPRSLEQVFTNLISNALEAMVDVGDTLAVKASPIQEINGHACVEISISDNGPGIPPDIREHIFEPFVTTRQKGTGLGLAITKQIVNAHKGSIRVDSFPGGTVFSVQIPAESGD